MNKIEWIRKRDGRLVPFEEARIARAIFAAAQALGGEDRHLAAELAGVVTLFLQKDFQDSIPGIEEIQDMVERVLIETGHARTAKAYILYRQKRAERRAQLAQAEAAAPAPAAAGEIMVHAESSDQLVSWSRGRIARALEAEADLPRAQAEAVAQAVEGRVCRSGLRRISTALIRELVDNELFERGFATTLARQKVVGIPKFDLEELLRGTARSPRALRDAIAGQVLRRYALQEMYSAAVARAHLEERLHIHGLEDPVRFPASAHSLEHLKRYGLFIGEQGASSAPARHPRSLSGQLFAMLHALGEFVNGPISLPFLNIFYAPFVAELNETELRQEAQHLIFTVSQMGESGGYRPEFHLHPAVPFFLRGVPAVGPGGGFTGRSYGDYEEAAGRFARSLLEVWRAGDERGRAFTRPACLFHVGEEAFGGSGPQSLLELACRVAAENGTPRFVFDREAVWLAPGCVLALPGEKLTYLEQPHRLRRFLLQKVTLNLPGAARATGDPDRLFARLGEDVILAIRTNLERRAFLNRLLSGPGMPLWEMGRLDLDGEPYVSMDRTAALLGVIGLNECVQVLTGQELHESEQALNLGARILSFLHFAVRDRAREAGLACRLGETGYGREMLRLAGPGRKFAPPPGALGGIAVRLDANLGLSERLRAQGRLHRALDGEAAAHVFVGPGRLEAPEVVELVRECCFQTAINQLVLAREFTVCRRCGRMAAQWQERCADCGAGEIFVMPPPPESTERADQGNNRRR